jgi:hypothetical protein
MAAWPPPIGGLWVAFVYFDGKKTRKIAEDRKESPESSPPPTEASKPVSFPSLPPLSRPSAIEGPIQIYFIPGYTPQFNELRQVMLSEELWQEASGPMTQSECAIGLQITGYLALNAI